MSYHITFAFGRFDNDLIAHARLLQSLLLEENDVAIAAGVNLMLLDSTMSAICQLQALSPDGRCKSFDAMADGYGRGEATSVIVLHSFYNGNNVSVVIVKGSAVNQVSVGHPLHKCCSHVKRRFEFLAHHE